MAETHQSTNITLAIICITVLEIANLYLGNDGVYFAAAVGAICTATGIGGGVMYARKYNKGR